MIDPTNSNLMNAKQRIQSFYLVKFEELCYSLTSLSSQVMKLQEDNSTFRSEITNLRNIIRILNTKQNKLM